MIINRNRVEPPVEKIFDIHDDGRTRSLKNGYYPENVKKQGAIFTEQDIKAFYNLSWFWKGDKKNNLNLKAVCEVLWGEIDYSIEYILERPKPEELEDFEEFGEKDAEGYNLEFEKALLKGNRFKYWNMYDRLLSLWLEEQKKDKNSDINFKRRYSEKNYLEMENFVLPGFIFMILNLRDGSLVSRYKKMLMNNDNELDLWSVEKELLLAFSKILWDVNVIYCPFLEDIDALYYKAMKTMDDKRKPIFSKAKEDKQVIKTGGKEKNIESIKKGITALIKEIELDTLKEILAAMEKALNKVVEFHKADYKLRVTDAFLKTKLDIIGIKVAFIYNCLDAYYILKFSKRERMFMEYIDNAIMQERILNIIPNINKLYPSAPPEGQIDKDSHCIKMKASVESAIADLEKIFGLKTVPKKRNQQKKNNEEKV